MHMAIQYPAILDARIPAQRYAYTERDVLLYALSVGMAHDPLDLRRLKFVYERDLSVLPTFCCVLGHQSIRDMNLGIDYAKVVHAAQEVVIHRTLPPSGEILSELAVEEVIDRGEKGAVLVMRRTITDPKNDDVIAELRSHIACRGDGGFGGPKPQIAAMPAPPQRQSEFVVTTRTEPAAALLYRLNGDLNPLHADPATAARAGFDRPILHGLATFAIGANAVLQAVCDFQPEKVRAIRARFSAPVFPSEILRVEVWREAPRAHFRVTAVERETVVLNDGSVDLAT
jgi:acyl dehydratase